MTTRAQIENPESHSDDVRRMLLLQSGRLEEMDVLAERHRRRLIRFLHRMTNDAQTAEDLTQEVLLSVYLARANYQPAAEFTTWLYCIALNRARKWARRERHPHQGLEAVPLDAFAIDPSHQLLDSERRRRIREAVESLPPRGREAVKLHRFEECDYNEVAERMHCSLSAVKSILFRTHGTLRKKLEEYGPA